MKSPRRTPQSWVPVEGGLQDTAAQPSVRTPPRFAVSGFLPRSAFGVREPSRHGTGPPASLECILRGEFTRNRQLNRGNAQPASIGADFGRLEIKFWDEVRKQDPGSDAWKADLELLNEWRNAIAHQDFTSPRLGGGHGSDWLRFAGGGRPASVSLDSST